MEIQTISIPDQILEWSDWLPWGIFLRDARSDPHAIRVSNEAGVYEARVTGEEVRFTIEKASNLRMRVKQGLVKGKVPHSIGDRIRDEEHVTSIEIRFATTDRPAAVEEELHRLYLTKFGTLPKYTLRT